MGVLGSSAPNPERTEFHTQHLWVLVIDELLLRAKGYLWIKA